MQYQVMQALAKFIPLLNFTYRKFYLKLQYEF